MLEYQFVKKCLKNMQKGENSVLVIHSSFSSLSKLGFSAARFCDGLIRESEDSTILMPTMTWRTVTPEENVFSELETPSHTGILTEIFRLKYATHRSLHPTHSVAGRGRLSKRLLSTHNEGTTPCADNSPYGIMKDYNSYVLLVGGVGLEVCTAIHHLEEVFAEDIYVEPIENGESYILIDRWEHEHHVQTRRHKKVERDFNKFFAKLKIDSEYFCGQVESIPWKLISLNALYRVVSSELRHNLRGTLKDI